MVRIAIAASLLFIVSCPAPPPPPEGPPPPPPLQGTVDAGAPPAVVDAAPPPPVGAADGAKCNAAADCQSGICEGEGCGPMGGVCASKQRACTMDYRPYCGCDGVTFHGSGGCPNRRYAYRGECKPGGAGGGTGPGDWKPGTAPDGARCLRSDQCASGVCEGEGCGPEGGTCAPSKRACTKDLRPYCGCDSKTFRTSGSCPGRRFAYRGECTTKGVPKVP
jgi:hypothetical protein